jgi:hypothetical protein
MSKFELNKTYKFNATIQAFMAAVMQIQYAGEQGIFTVHQVDADGSVWTDDLTSPITTDRCKIPAGIVHECEVVNG